MAAKSGVCQRLKLFTLRRRLAVVADGGWAVGCDAGFRSAGRLRAVRATRSAPALEPDGPNCMYNTASRIMANTPTSTSLAGVTPDEFFFADLLSTFTGCWTLADLGALDRADRPRVREYVLALQGPQGGFRGGTWDAGLDVEYTFYGIGALALFADG